MSVYTIVDLVKVAVVDVARTETDGRCARVVVPVVVVLGYVQVAGVLGTVGVGVPDQRGFPVVVDVTVGDGYEVCGVGELFSVSRWFV